MCPCTAHPDLRIRAEEPPPNFNNLPDIPIADSWDEFVRDWCLGWEPPCNQAHAVCAFATLETHWPERLAQLHYSGARGIAVVMGYINRGAVLADISGCPGFQPVLARARRGEASAWSDLTFGALLQRNRFAVRFGEEVGGRELDIAADVDGITVYIEVVRPELSDLDKDARTQILRLQDFLAVYTGRHLQIELTTFPTDDVLEQLRKGIQTAPMDEWVELGDVARLRVAMIPEGGPRVELGWPGNEHRADRLISSEYHHFAADVPYMLAVDTSNTTLSADGWTAAFARVLQPARNRRVGATVAYHPYSLASDLIRRFCIRTHANPYARRAVPARLLKVLSEISQPWLRPTAS